MTGFEALGFESHAEFFEAMLQRLPDLILLDVMLPEMNGFDILRRLKSHEKTRHIPIMMITACDDENNRVNSLESGADDYISKPLSMMELVARVKAVLRRCSSPSQSNQLEHGCICMDIERHTVECSGQTIQLTLKEFTLLRILLEAGGHLVEREKLIMQVWGGDYTSVNHTLDAHIQTLRSKLGEAGKYIQTIYGRGYRLRATATTNTP